jgi:hypothetical protein
MRQCQRKYNVCSLIFSHRGFSWEQLWHFMMWLSPIFPTGFQEFLHKHLLYTYSDFPTRFFEDSIHSMRCSSAQGGVLQHKYIEWPLEHDRQPPPRHQPPVWPAPTWHPFDRTVTSSSSRVTEPAQKWGVHLLESKLGNSQQSENASNTHTKHAKSRFHWKLSYYTIV